MMNQDNVEALSDQQLSDLANMIIAEQAYRNELHRDEEREMKYREILIKEAEDQDSFINREELPF